MRVLLALVLLAGAAVPAAAQTPTVDELIAKNLEARGGAEKLKAIDTRKVTGTVRTQGMELGLEVLASRPNKMRQEMMLQGRSIVTAYDGQQAWTINPMMGGEAPVPLSGPQAEALKEQAWFDGPLLGARQRGEKIEVVGKEDVAGRPTWKLAITRPTGQVTHIFLDAETGLERQVSAELSQNGTALQVQSLISDYQPVNGIMVPRKVETLVGGQPQGTVTIEKVEFGIPVPDEVFSMPRKP